MAGNAVSFMTGGDVAPMRLSGLGMFGDLASRFRSTDISFVNLEHSLSTRGALSRGRERFHRGLPNNADGLREAGLSCVNIANNHILDYNDDGLLETLDALKERGIPYFGAGANLSEARRPCIVEKAGLRVGLLGYTTTLPRGFAASESAAGVNPLNVNTAYQAKRNLPEYPGVAPHIVTWTEPDDLERMREDVSALAAQSDLVMVYVHWGTSMTPYVHDFQREIGHAAIDAGAHAVFGGHQHVVCGIEFYKGFPIVHGSGNLLFDKWEPFFTEETLKTFLVGATLEPGKVRDIFVLPVRNGVEVPPTLLARSSPMWSEIHGALARESRAFGTSVIAREDRIDIRAS
jgi:poly-gamma-glutamate synthesis protein (capsule biosynthesis protein)